MSRKNNKKSFSSNLEILFEERLLDDNAQDNISMLEGEVSNDDFTTILDSKKTKNKTSRKSFSTNLEQFFKDSLDGVLDGLVPEVKRNIVGKGKKRAVGIDLLIKRTTDKDVNPIINRPDAATKRITLTLDSDKLEELKRIAKLEKKQLQQIIGKLVADFINEK